jgi:fructokinase
MYDVVALGESLIDFTPAGKNEQGMQLFSQNPGGAPANVLAMNTKLGGKTAFIGKVGADNFGFFLQATMEAAGINCIGLCKDKIIPTTLAFVQLDKKGDRSFTFYRKPGAYGLLRPEEVPMELVTGCHIFHFGSVSLTDEPCRSATLQAAQAAKRAGALISFDPNYRPFLWTDAACAKAEIQNAMPLADFLKVSDEEMELLTGETELSAGAAKLAAMGPEFVFVTLGPKGAYYLTPTGTNIIPTYDVNTVDTTGAGDAFWGALLFSINGRDKAALKNMSQDEWDKIVAFANATGSLTTTAKGAIPAMPMRNEIEDCMLNIALL